MKASFSQRSQAGFTLVELVTVILILGVLAAVALPRYADLQGKAREAKVKAVAGSIKAAAGLAKAQAMASSISCATATGTNVSLEGRTIALNHCYPTATTTFTAGILGAANVEAGDNWTATISSGTDGGVAAVMDIRLSDAGTPANCKIIYTAAANATTPPAITTDTSAC